MAPHLPREQVEHTVARRSHPEGRNVPNFAVDVDRLQVFPQHRFPVTRIPLELLAHIFELYVAPFGEFTPHTVSSRAPFYLAQVCKLWRAVSESDPHLWTSIHFYFPESYENQNGEKDVLRVKLLFDLHLKRSGALPVSLAFIDNRTHHLTTYELISLLVDQLRNHARRWKRISLQLPGAYFPLLFTFTPCDLSSLEHLYINGNIIGCLRRITVPRLSLESATNLKSFSYSGPGPSMNDMIDLHWENLGEVAFGFAPHSGKSYTLARRFVDLARCQNITTCSLGLDSPPHLNNPSITLPRLQTLRVRRLDPEVHAGGAIDILILPQLQTLEIDASILDGWRRHWHDHNFSGLLARSGCSLLHLSIKDVDFPNDELVRCLTLSPALTSLRFIPCPRSQDISDVIRKLDVSCTPTGGQTRSQRWREGLGVISGPLLPQLREITLAISKKGCLDPMMAMFRSRVGSRARAAGVAALRRAEVVFFDLWHDTDVEQVGVRGVRLEKVASFRADLAQWVSENRKENGREDEDQLEASVVVDSPYLPEYIDIQ